MNTGIARAVVFLWIMGAACPVWAGAGLLAHKVVAGDSIRSLLLTYSCVRSMSDYAKIKEEFVKVNPGVTFSGELKAGGTILVPAAGSKKDGGCLSPEELRLVRVEFEILPGKELIRLYLDGPVLPDMFMLRDSMPLRMVCDFDVTLPAAGLQREMETQGRLVRRIRVGHQDKPFKRARVVLELDQDQAGRVDQEFFEKSSMFLITVRERAGQ